MYDPLASALLFFGISSLVGASAAVWNLRNRRRKDLRRTQRSEEGWLRSFEQPAAALYQEERHSLRDSGEPGIAPFRIVREMRFISRESGALVAILPERQVGTASTEREGNEIVEFFQETTRNRDSLGAPQQANAA